MPRRFAIILFIVIVLALLVALNAASYMQLEEQLDSELKPDRSTTHRGATGTSAFYEFLQESGYKVVRWRQSPAALLSDQHMPPDTLVVIGALRREFTKDEAEALCRWVAQGGHLVLIDRAPDRHLLPSAGPWHVAAELVEYPAVNVRPDDVEQMTAGVKPLSPLQPTRFARDVEQVMRSRFASRLHVYAEAPAASATPQDTSTQDAERSEIFQEPDGEETSAATDSSPDAPTSEQTPPPSASEIVEDAEREESSPAPVEHFADGREGPGALLVDYVYGSGRISVLSDPFMLSNAGLSRADNLSLAINLVTGAGDDGIIAFDEFHHGRIATQNQLFAYFAGTPVLAIAAQLGLILLAVMWTRGRRFARPLPAPQTDRRSNLEFVASMAELQQRARAYDLAIENIYTRTRRALARYGGTSSAAPSPEIAARVASRSGRPPRELADLMRECEDAIAGAHVSAPRTLQLVARLRELERDLGIRMRARELRQARDVVRR